MTHVHSLVVSITLVHCVVSLRVLLVVLRVSKHDLLALSFFLLRCIRQTRCYACSLLSFDLVSLVIIILPTDADVSVSC